MAVLFVLFLIPFIISIVVQYDLARSFGFGGATRSAGCCCPSAEAPPYLD